MRLVDRMRKAMRGEERLSVVWWGWGLFTGVVYCGLYVAADELRASTSIGADLLDIVKLFLFAAWAIVTWRCSKNVDAAGWTLAARVALIISVGLTAATL